MLVIKFSITLDSQTKMTVEKVPEYNIRRTCTHIPLTNVWIYKHDPSSIFCAYIVFPRLHEDNSKDVESLHEKVMDAQTIMYQDKKKLETLTKKDSSYTWKE